MDKSLLKKALLLSGVVILGYHAQKYARLFMALRSPQSMDEDTEKADDLEELLRNGDAIKVRISSVDEDSSDEEDDE